MSGYVELHCHSCFSLLDGASTPEALLDCALNLGMTALALTDHDGLYGAMRFYLAAKERGIQPIMGAELVLQGEQHLVLLAQNQEGYRNLCWLISRAQLDGSKGQARLAPSWLHDRTLGLIALTGCAQGGVARALLAGQRDQAILLLQTLRELFGRDHLYVELQRHFLPADRSLVADLAEAAHQVGLPLVATNNVHYALREGQHLQDALVAIRHNVPLTDAQCWLRPNSEFYLKSPQELGALFADYPEALEETLRISEHGRVEMSVRHEALPPSPCQDRLSAAPPPPAGGAPADPAPPPSEQEQLAYLCHQAMPRCYPQDPRAAQKQLAHELGVIQHTGLAGYFLTVWDIVRYSRERGIQVRGRGSAANSIVAYLLGITNIDPLAHDLLFERFLSAESLVMPDIDLDFCSRRREEVIQYLYERYGEANVGMVCNYVTYRQRSAVRDVGKALGFPVDTLDHLAKALGKWGQGDLLQVTQEKLGLAAGISSRLWEQFLTLCTQIMGLPRHLGIHVGGMCITRSPLNEIVPLERATMPGRVVIQWDKDALEDAGLIKIDILSLRTLSAVDECLQLAQQTRGQWVDLDALPLDDPLVYEALCRADTIGAFQVESRAQQQALYKMRPRCFADIIVEVAIIRPGPLQGNMVHPFFRRRMGLEPVRYYHPLLKPILQETLGVVIFQEQVIRVAMVMGSFTAGEADLLRRAMSRHRSDEQMARFRQRFVFGALAQGVPQQVAEEVFSKLAGFASYGFCKSHAAAFAKTAYDTLYLRAHYPAEYYCALLNNQPMGYYAPRVLVNDARRHGLSIRRVHINRSQARCTVEELDVIRLGLLYVDSLGEAGAERVVKARGENPFSGLDDFCRRTRLPRQVVEKIILAGGLDEWEQERRQFLWLLGRLRYQEEELPLPLSAEQVQLEPMTDAERLVGEYGVTGMAAEGHLLELYRESLNRAGIGTSQDLERTLSGRMIRLAGMVVVRQAPPTANGFVFLTLEDEWGLMNVIINPNVYQRQRAIWSGSLVLALRGRVQRADGQTNILAEEGSSIK